MYRGRPGIPPFHALDCKTLRELEEAVAFIEADRGKTFETLVIDPITVFYQVQRAAVSKNHEKDMSYRDWAKVNSRMQAVYTKLTNLPVHVVVIAREANEYAGEGTDLKVIGKKPDADKSLVYNFDFTLRMREAEAQRDELIEAMEERDQRMLTPEAPVHIAELRKTMRARIRLWEVDDTGKVENPLEGTAVVLNSKAVVVASTGAATLHQGTAKPLLFTGNGYCPEILEVGQAGFAATQLNYSSLEVAQWLPVENKRADEELAARAAQEIRKLT